MVNTDPSLKFVSF
jgi:hypothetical protein